MDTSLKNKPLRDKYQAALERAGRKVMTTTPQNSPANSFFVSDAPRRLTGSRAAHPLPKPAPPKFVDQERRENEVEHRNIYAVKSYQELLNRLRGGQPVQVRNERLGFMVIQDLGIELRLGGIFDLTILPFREIFESQDLRSICEGGLVAMEGRFE